MGSVYSWLVLLPFIVFMLLLLIKRTPLVWVSLTALVLVAGVSVLAWRIDTRYLIGSGIKGALVAFDIFVIIFGAILFLELLKNTRVIQNIGFYLESISKDIRVQVVFLAWFFENFLEGTAGFGTPATIIVPLLMALGINALDAVVIVLLGNSASALFGAAGTPIKVGFAGIAGVNTSYFSALINFAGIIVPAAMIWFLLRKDGNRTEKFIEALPFAVWSGIAFLFPAVLALGLGEEFPSIIGAVIGILLVFITNKLGIFVPKTHVSSSSAVVGKKAPLMEVVFPHAVLIMLLILGKFVIGQRGMPLPLVIPHTLTFFNPGLAFILAGVIVSAVYKIGGKVFYNSAATAFKKSIEPFFVVAFMSIVAQLMINSRFNQLNIPSMVTYLTFDAQSLPLNVLAPILGAFGSFITGSATVSNLMFGGFLFATSVNLGLNTEIVLALAAVGAAAGNMIALADVITAEAVAGIKNRERRIIKEVFLPCLLYIGIACLMGAFILNG